MYRPLMKYIDLTLPTPEQNLAFDEALLDWCEDGSRDEILRFWEPREYFIVLGYSRKVNSDVYLAPCQANNIPIFRRSSGGGTVLQGPGCLNFSLILKIENSKALSNITETNCYIMQCHKKALEPIAGTDIEIQGSSDLAVRTLKFSGNAQRRKRRFLLFHGTFLTSFDIALVEKLLPIPEKQPPYRKNRTHTNFLTNLDVPPQKIKEAIQMSWNAVEPFDDIPFEKINQLVKDRYATRAWNFKF